MVRKKGLGYPFYTMNNSSFCCSNNNSLMCGENYNIACTAIPLILRVHTSVLCDSDVSSNCAPDRWREE